MVAKQKSYGVIASLLLLVMGLGSFAANSREAWVDEAMEFAEQLKSTYHSKPQQSVEEIELAISTLTPVKRLEAYQRLSFMYLTDWRIEQYKTFKETYAADLSQYGQDEHLDMQTVLDLLEATITPATLDEAIITIEALIKSKVLTDEAHVLVHVVHIWARNLKRKAPFTLNAMRRAKSAYALSNKSEFAGLALELASAYTSLNIYDYAQSNKSYRAAYTQFQAFDYLQFNVDNYLTNLTWMLRQASELQLSIDIIDWQLAQLTQDSEKQFAFYVYFACGIYQQINGEFERALNCLLTAKDLVEHAPNRWVSINTGLIITAINNGQVALAKQFYSEFLSDPRSNKAIGPLDKMHLAKAYLDIENGESRKAIDALNNYYVNNVNQQIGSFRALSMEYIAFVNSEIETLEQNNQLQQRLIKQQTILNGFGVAIIMGLAFFSVFLLKSRRKQRILATHDSLTRLFNRRGFYESFSVQLEKAKREGTHLVLAIMDIDGFKKINDIHGHKVGDRVLKVTAARLKEELGKDLIAGRMGADEFAFLLPNTIDTNELMQAGAKVCDTLSKDIQLANLRLKPSVTLGFSSYPAVADNIQQLTDCADFALRECKHYQRGACRVFSPCDQSLLDERRNLEAALANAQDDEFTLNYQAIVDASTEKVVGFEALARWQSKELGFVSPAAFIPIAEQTGFINKLSRYLLAKALEEASTWPADLSLSFNLSSQDVNSIENAEIIKQIVSESSFPNTRLIAEMTETAIVQDTSTTSEALRLLTDIGVSVALDDFGTGYSSINHLLDFEFERIKLDKVLIDSIENDANKFEIVQTLVNLCHNLKIDCVIEGIETDIQKQHLRKMNVDKFQGYLYSKPIPPEAIPAFLSNNSKTVGTKA